MKKFLILMIILTTITILNAKKYDSLTDNQKKEIFFSCRDDLNTLRSLYQKQEKKLKKLENNEKRWRFLIFLKLGLGYDDNFDFIFGGGVGLIKEHLYFNFGVNYSIRKEMFFNTSIGFLF